MQKQREYGLPFKLDETKFTAIVDTAHGLLSDHQRTLVSDRYEVFFSEIDQEELGSLDDVLALDNSHARRIQRVIMTFSSALQPSSIPDREIQIDYGAKRSNASGTKKTIVEINIRSDDASWARHALSALEQQVERTWQRYTVPTVWLLIIVAAIGLLLVTALPSSTTVGAYTMWLNGPDISRTQELLRNGTVLTEEEEREIFTMQLRNVVKGQIADTQTNGKSNLKQYLLGAATLFVVVCAVVLLVKGYPMSVFYWGDGIDRYSSALTMRNVLWTLILGVTVIAVFGTVVAESVKSAFFTEH
jgi:hypothetical protein